LIEIIEFNVESYFFILLFIVYIYLSGSTFLSATNLLLNHNKTWLLAKIFNNTTSFPVEDGCYHTHC